MTVDSASKCTLSASVHYFIIKSKYFTSTAGFITVGQNVWYSSIISLSCRHFCVLLRLKVVVLLHYIHQDSILSKESDVLCC